MKRRRRSVRRTVVLAPDLARALCLDACRRAGWFAAARRSAEALVEILEAGTYLHESTLAGEPAREVRFPSG